MTTSSRCGRGDVQSVRHSIGGTFYASEALNPQPPLVNLDGGDQPIVDQPTDPLPGPVIVPCDLSLVVNILTTIVPCMQSPIGHL